MKRRAARVLALLFVLAAPFARAEAPKTPPVLTGAWVATSQSGEIFAGRWSAELAVATPNAAIGSWTLTNEMGGVLMQGTWAARKGPRGWRGAWSARVAPAGTTLSGTWEADASTVLGQKTFADLLRRTAEAQVSGAWRAGHAHGKWWFKTR